MSFFKDRISATTAAVCAIILIATAVAYPSLFRDRFSHTHVRCAIQPREKNDTTRGLLTGYNYHLLEQFANDAGITLDIELVKDPSAALDSIRSGALDILSIPFADTLMIDSVQVSIPVDSISTWIVGHGETALLEKLNSWISDYHVSAGYDSTRALFMNTYNPVKAAKAGRTRNALSPYDRLFRHYADSLGLDWKFLAAVAYKESFFRIEARSRRGAAGLMQMMPRTAQRMGAEDLLNPEESIRAGAAYLHKLHVRYRRYSGVERMKFTLAAYNAGEGRIRACINRAQDESVSTASWDSVATVIPLIEDFKGVETVNYVKQVMEIYESFRRLCPED